MNSERKLFTINFLPNILLSCHEIATRLLPLLYATKPPNLITIRKATERQREVYTKIQIFPVRYIAFQVDVWYQHVMESLLRFQVSSCLVRSVRVHVHDNLDGEKRKMFGSKLISYLTGKCLAKVTQSE